MLPKHIRLLFRAALLAVLVAVTTHTRADPDLFGNIRFGNDVLAARSAVVHDDYSYTSAGTFYNHEWLAEAILSSAFDVAGAPGLVAVKLALLLFVGLAVLAALRVAGIESGDGDLVVAVAAVAIFPQSNQIRAQLFSLALFSATLLTLIAGDRSPRALMWLIPILAIWPNLHGGWIVAAGTLGVWSAIGVLRTPWSRGAWIAGVVSIVALAATVANPWGWRMWTFLYETVGVDRADIRDWQPVFRLGVMYGLLWLLVAATAVLAAAAAAKERALDWRAVAVVTMFGVASYRVSRITAFFALSTVMLLGPHAARWLARMRASRPAHTPSRPAAAAAAIAALTVIVGAASLSAANVGCIRMEGDLFPEPEVASFVRTHHLSGRLLNWFDYGHYAIWHFSPALKVSIDGRRETLYSRQTIDRHLAFYFDPGSRRATIDAFAPDYIWLPTSLEVTKQLTADGWQPLFAGPQSTLLSRPSNLANGDGVNAANALNSGNGGLLRCFPGP